MNKNASDLTVAIFGGGVAGMSAAHELAERGFRVKIYEKQSSIPGGKARSMPVEGTGLEGRKDLPGEHGFRFFPRFYKHITDTMRRIPFADNLNGVADNLVETERTLISVRGKKDIYQQMVFPRSLDEFKQQLSMFDPKNFPDLETGEFKTFMRVLIKAMTSCDERIENELESVSAWDYLESEGKSDAYLQLFSDQSRILVAANPKYMSARVFAKINPHMFYGGFTPGPSGDRLLNGPTNDVWIDPWYRYLLSLGVDYNFGHQATEIQLQNGIVSKVSVSDGKQEFDVEADFYIMALPVEVINKLITPDLQEEAPSLQGISELVKDVAWMNGVIFYLSEPIDIVSGHTFFAGSPWALTSIEQHKFWTNYDLSEYGDGNVKGILSIDVSDWETPGLLHKKPARECTPWEIAEEVWFQVTQWVNDTADAHTPLSDSIVNNWFIDTDIKRDETIADHYNTTNDEPLLINKPNTWQYRPEAVTEIANLFLASDYVRTNTDLATMEAANEAARSAANGIIEASGVAARKCEIWKLERPVFLQPLIALDKARYLAGQPWQNPLPFEL